MKDGNGLSLVKFVYFTRGFLLSSVMKEKTIRMEFIARIGFKHAIPKFRRPTMHTTAGALDH
jgi:hypothetical protein